MRIQTTDSYTLDVSMTWIAPDQIQLVFARADEAIGQTQQEYYLTPEQLMTITDYLNDRMCR